MSLTYSLGKTIKKGVLDGAKAALATDAVLGAIARPLDPESMQEHVTAVTVGIITGLVRALGNWWKNRNR